MKTYLVKLLYFDEIRNYIMVEETEAEAINKARSLLTSTQPWADLYIETFSVKII